MKFYIGVTDNAWFKFLADRQPDEVNFWQPSGERGFERLKAGELFLFKLHFPDNYIDGGGFFVKHSLVPLSLAWEAFGEKNGTPDLIMRRRNEGQVLFLDLPAVAHLSRYLSFPPIFPMIQYLFLFFNSISFTHICTNNH